MESQMKTIKSFEAGDEILVGEFFWTNKEMFIGFDKNALHGNSSLTQERTGSVDIDCKLEIRGIERANAVVSLNRPHTPYGAEAPIGTVFKISLEIIKKWPDKIKKRKMMLKKQKTLFKKYTREH